jgi:hypothetical protein
MNFVALPLLIGDPNKVFFISCIALDGHKIARSLRQMEVRGTTRTKIPRFIRYSAREPRLRGSGLAG